MQSRSTQRTPSRKWRFAELRSRRFEAFPSSAAWTLRETFQKKYFGNVQSFILCFAVLLKDSLPSSAFAANALYAVIPQKTRVS